MDTLFHPDAPIQQVAQDRLGRAGLAKSIARQIILSPLEDGFVVGLLGPWGSGKSSILNLVALELAADDTARVIRFNPWLVSGTAELATRFFGEVGSALKLRKEPWAKELGSLFESYGDLLLPLEMVPLVGAPWAAVGKAVKATGAFLTGRTRGAESLEAKRDKIREALTHSSKRLVFILDDIDRLHNDEILEVMRLVRLVGDFPNCVYLLAFDRARVAEAIQPQGGDAHLYLEKILQVVHEVPPIRRSDLGRLLLEDIDKATKVLPTGPFDQELWENLFPLGIFPLFTKVRDIRRYVNGLVVTLEAVGEEVALADVLALEAIRILKPDVFCRIPDAVDALTTPARDTGGKRNPDHEKQVKELLAVAGKDHDAIEQLLTRLFPASQQYLKNTHFGAQWSQKWSKARRVAHERPLRYYLERSYPADTLTNALIQELFESLGDEAKLRAFLDGMTPEVLEQALERLQDFEEDYPPVSVEPALGPLFAQLPRLSDDMRGFFSFSPQVQLERVVYRLLKRVDDPVMREALIQRVYGRLETLRAKRVLVQMSGHAENAGHGFVTEAVAKALEERLTADIVAASPETLAAEGDLVRTCFWVEQHGSAEQMSSLRTMLREKPVVLTMLRTGLQETRSQTMGDVAMHREWRLPWKELQTLVGVDALNSAVGALVEADAKDDRAREALTLAKRYAGGWRPKNRFGEEEG